MSAASESSPARSRHDVTTVPAPWRVATRPSASSRAEGRAEREAVHPESERQLPLRRQPRPCGETPREDLAAQPVGHGVDDARAGDGAEDGERLGGADGAEAGVGRRGSSSSSTGSTTLRAAPVRNPFRTS